MLEVDEATNTAVAKASITYTADKQIKWIHIMLNGENIESQTPTFDVSCAITPINEDVGTNSRLTIHKTVENSSELLEVLPKTYFTYVESGCDLVGIGQYYFGARYYDPELGVWGSTDPKGQFFNPYGYSTNPANTIDPNGQWFQAFMAALQWYGSNAASSGELNPAKWDWSDPMLWLSTATTAFSVGMDLGNDFSQLAARKSRTTFAEGGDKPKFDRKSERAMTDRENQILRDNFYQSDNKHMDDQVRPGYETLSKEGQVQILREGIQEFGHKRFGTQSDYRLGPNSKLIDGDVAGSSTPKGYGVYKELVHSQRLESYPSTKDFSNVVPGHEYYMLYNSVYNLPEIMQYGVTKGINWVQPLKLEF